MMRVSEWMCLASLGLARPLTAQGEVQPDPGEQFVTVEIGVGERAIGTGLNRFGFDLYAQMRGARGDVVVSPASVSTAFGLAYAGAKGETAAQIASTLHYPHTSGDFHRSFGRLLATLRLAQNGRTLAVNNALWLQTDTAVLPTYQALIDRHYSAGIQRVDFRASPATARTLVNRWVQSKTNDQIRDLLAPDDIRQSTRSVLVNTIYFRADWAEPFDPGETGEGTFKPVSGRPVTLQMMRRRARFAYAEAGGVKALSMPYRGGETEMILLLPDSGESLTALEKTLDPAALGRWVERLGTSDRGDVIVTLPRFKIERRYDLTETLKKLGMRVPFSNSSDFSGIKSVDAGSPDREQWNLKIDKVIHQLFVEVEEKGTEAAAATATAEIIVSGRRIDQQPPKIFRADHPFLFIIRDRRTATNLFMGRFSGEDR